MKVHPFANRWPMLSTEELNDLAEDIKRNGLIHPIVVTEISGEEILVEGRNRLRACEIAGVEPRYEQLNGQDPVAFIISNNAARRHMSKGALAMVVATEYPQSEGVGGHKKKSSVAEHFPMVTSGKLSMARTVVKYAGELVDQVIGGGKSLDDAYEVALARRKAAQSDEAKIDQLAGEASDLAEQVKEERLPLSEAWAAFEQRKRDAEKKAQEEHEARFRHTMRVYETISYLFPRGGIDVWLIQFYRDIDPNLWPQPALQPFDAETIHACANALHALADKLEEHHG